MGHLLRAAFRNPSSFAHDHSQHKIVFLITFSVANARARRPMRSDWTREKADAFDVNTRIHQHEPESRKLIQ